MPRQGAITEYVAIVPGDGEHGRALAARLQRYEGPRLARQCPGRAKEFENVVLAVVQFIAQLGGERAGWSTASQSISICRDMNVAIAKLGKERVYLGICSRGIGGSRIVAGRYGVSRGPRLRNRVGIRALAQIVQISEACQNVSGRHTEVQQTGDLINPGALAALDHSRAGGSCSKKAAGFEVTFEGNVEHRFDLGRGQTAQIHVLRFPVTAAGRFENGKRAGQFGHQLERAAQVILHRPANQFAHFGIIVAHERVQHEGDVARTGPVSMLAPGPSIDLNPLR